MNIRNLKHRIYLDYNATTPVDPEVRAVMNEFMEQAFGNPSSIYQEGKVVHQAVDSARRSAAQFLNSTANCIIFTGGGSEANNLAIKGTAFRSFDSDRRHIITSSVEHPSVLAACRWLEKRGFEVTFLDVDRTGRVNPESLDKAISGRTCLVSIMTANNETGVIQPVAELSNICRRHGVPFHTDATQAAGKIPLDVEELGVDMLTLSSHKFYGPKGTGLLYVRKGIELVPLIHGGGQEGGLRAGTENTPGIVGMGKACELAARRLPEMERIRKLRDALEEGIRKIIPVARLNGHRTERLPNTLNMMLPGFRGESVVLAMDNRGVAFSSGSACRSGSPKPSHTLTAMGLSEEEAHCSIRLSLGIRTTEEEISRVLKEFDYVLKQPGETEKFRQCGYTPSS
jgi:cysteine desulfurase NifS